jgi:pantoate--beta-alanine ligase
LSAALLAGSHAARGGADEALREAGSVLSEVPAIDVDYLEVRDSGLGPAPVSGAGRLLVAARLGKTRLLDNVAIEIGTTVGADGRVPAIAAESLESHWRN